jgi:hypothetical protein
MIVHGEKRSKSFGLAQKAKRSESCKFRAKGLLLVIMPKWLEVGFRKFPTAQPDTYVAQRFG